MQHFVSSAPRLHATPSSRSPKTQESYYLATKTSEHGTQNTHGMIRLAMLALATSRLAQTAQAAPAPQSNDVASPWGWIESHTPDVYFHANQSLARRDGLDGPFGTNEDLPGFGTPALGGFGLLGADAARLNSAATPVAPDPKSCPYSYAPSVQSNGKAIALTRPNTPFDSVDVAQGGVGDCGFGAALLAMRGNGEIDALRRALTPNGGPTSNPKFQARFLGTMGTKNVFLDSKLPALSASKANCKAFASFQAPQGVFYVPLLEKAWAKYVDVYPELRFQPTGLSPQDKAIYDAKSGYPALTTMPPQNVFRAINGGRRKFVGHNKQGFDQAFAEAIIRCLNVDRACAVVTPKSERMQALFGPPVANGLFKSSAGDITDNGKNTYTIKDADRGGIATTLVDGHWYAIMRNRSPTIKSNKAFNVPNNAVVTLRNPWGCNPAASDNTLTCLEPKQGDIEISLRALWTMVGGLDTTTA